MRKLLFLIPICFLALSFSLPSSNGVKFREDGWGTASKAARQNGKPIFVFIRTYTCMTSARMDDVFEDPKVAAFFNENFVSLQMNPDKPMDNIRVTTWGAKSVPTFIFFNSNKDKIYSFTGYRDPDAVIKEAEKALKMMGINDYKRGTIQPSATKKSDSKDDDDDDDDDKD